MSALVDARRRGVTRLLHTGLLLCVGNLGREQVEVLPIVGHVGVSIELPAGFEMTCGTPMISGLFEGNACLDRLREGRERDRPRARRLTWNDLLEVKAVDEGKDVAPGFEHMRRLDLLGPLSTGRWVSLVDERPGSAEAAVRRTESTLTHQVSAATVHAVASDDCALLREPEQRMVHSVALNWAEQDDGAAPKYRETSSGQSMLDS